MTKKGSRAAETCDQIMGAVARVCGVVLRWRRRDDGGTGWARGHLDDG